MLGNYFRVMLITCGGLLAAACNQETLNSQNFALDTNIETTREVKIFYSDSAIVRVSIEGPEMLYHFDPRDPRQEFTKGVKVDFYDPDGTISSVLTGKYGMRYENKGLVMVRDSVIWQSKKGERLDTEELFWDERKKTVYNHKFSVITRPDEVIYGLGFEASQDFSYSKIIAPKGRKKVEEISKELE